MRVQDTSELVKLDVLGVFTLLSDEPLSACKYQNTLSRQLDT